MNQIVSVLNFNTTLELESPSLGGCERGHLKIQFRYTRILCWKHPLVMLLLHRQCKCRITSALCQWAETISTIKKKKLDIDATMLEKHTHRTDTYFVCVFLRLCTVYFVLFFIMPINQLAQQSILLLNTTLSDLPLQALIRCGMVTFCELNVLF